MAYPFYNPYRGSIGRFFAGDPNLVGYWQLQGSSIDNSGNGNNGTDTAVVYGQQGFKEGVQSAYFNGSAYSSMGNVLGFEYNQPFSIAAWINTKTTTSTNIISKQAGATGYQGYGLGTFSNGEYQIFLNSSALANLLEKHYSAPRIGRTDFVVFTYDGSNTIGGLNLYVNGVLQTPAGSTSVPFTGSILTTASFQLSGRNGATNLWNGYLAEPSVFSRALSPQEISQYYLWATSQSKPKWLGYLPPVVSQAYGFFASFLSSD